MQHRPRQSGLAATAFAYHAKGFAGAKREGNAVHRAQHAPGGEETFARRRKRDFDIVRLQQGLSGRDGEVRRIAEAGHRRQQHLGIILPRRVEDIVHRAAFHHFAIAHDLDLIGAARDHAHVVADEGQRGALVDLERAQDFQNLRLDRHVQGGGRLVGDDKIGAGDGGHRDHHPLAHPAGQFVRILLHPPRAFGNADIIQHLADAAPGFFPGHLLMKVQGFENLRPHRHVRGQRGERILEDHGDLGAAELIEPARRQAQQFLSAVAHAAAGAPVGGQQSHGGQKQLALARAALAHHTQAGAFLDIEAHPLDRMHIAVLGGEMDIEVADFQQRHGQ